MTLVIAWISRDQNKPSSAYIAADSRITQGRDYWDHGKKVFACKKHPIIFGYCGSVLVPSLLLAQLADAIDDDLLFDPSEEIGTKWQQVRSYLEQGLRGSPPFMAKEASEVYAFNRVNRSAFSAAHFVIDGERITMDHRVIESAESEVVKSLGSGKDRFGAVEHETRRNNSGVKTARIYFASFCRTIRSGAVATVGGAPQLTALRSTGMGRIIPVKFGEELWHQGIKVNGADYDGEAFDEEFQRINPETLQLVEGAQRQPIR